MKFPDKNISKIKEVNFQKIELINRTEDVLIEHFRNHQKIKNLKCLKIQKIDHHFKKCCKIKSCRWCREYFALLCYHTLYRCQNYLNCVVPYCKTIGLKYSSLNIKVRKINKFKLN